MSWAGGARPRPLEDRQKASVSQEVMVSGTVTGTWADPESLFWNYNNSSIWFLTTIKHTFFLLYVTFSTEKLKTRLRICKASMIFLSSGLEGIWCIKDICFNIMSKVLIMFHRPHFSKFPDPRFWKNCPNRHCRRISARCIKISKCPWRHHHIHWRMLMIHHWKKIY